MERTPKNIRIIVATHKQYRMPRDGMYLPLHVGKAGKEGIGYVGDDTGDNISRKNPSYCELTGVYWAWKNLQAAYIGLVHYRRHFSAGKKSCDPFDAILTRKELEPILEQHPIVVPRKRRYYIESLYSHYAHTFYKEHMDAARDIVAARSPEYLLAFDQVMARTWGYMFNMMVMRRDLFDSYCAWLFDILAGIEEKDVTPGLQGFHARFYGRISERLFNVWLLHAQETGMIQLKDIKELPWVYMGKIDWKRKIQGFLMAKVFHKKYDASF